MDISENLCSLVVLNKTNESLWTTPILFPNFICSYRDACFLRDFTKVIIKLATAMSRITGSASMKMGIVPAVRVTRVDESKIRERPDDKITKPARNLSFFMAMA